jgi:hypothetical protein
LKSEPPVPDKPVPEDSLTEDQAEKQGSTDSRAKRPTTIVALIEYAYAEAGRKLNFSRKELRKLAVNPADSQSEIDAVRRLAQDDPLLAVPASLLALLAESGLELRLRDRILELALVAFASHKLFEGRLERLMDVRTQPPLTANELSDAARSIEIRLPTEPHKLTEAARERLRVNCVTGFELFRVLRDGWTAKQFVADMSSLVWATPLQHHPAKAAALLSGSRNLEALSQMARHFEALLAESAQQATVERERATYLQRRADAAEASREAVTTELADERTKNQSLQFEIDELTRRLSAEKSNRVVDKSHMVDDYEALRTQIIRRLTAQVALLSDGLHAMRNGSTGVADEFVDRALTAIDAEVKRLKMRDGEER